MKRIFCGVVLPFALALVAPAFAPAATNQGHVKFMPQAKESNDLSTATLHAYPGTSGGQRVWFVITDASSKTWAAKYGANYVPKLQNAVDSGAVMHVAAPGRSQGFDFPFTPNFTPVRFIDANAGGGCAALPPGFLPIGLMCFQAGADGSYGQSPAGATGQNSYSPLIQFTAPDGQKVVLDAPQIKNSSGQADKILRLNTSADTVDYVETAGLYDDHTIHYVSFDSSNPLASAIENMTYAPAFGKTPSDPANENINGSTTSRAGIIAFTNGPLGLGNPERQGLNSIILDGASAAPNVIQFTPADTDANGIITYSPAWDVHLATWANPPNAERVGLFEEVQMRSNQPAGTPTGDGPLAQDGTGEITAPDGGTFGPSGFDVNCPIISTDADGVVIIPPPS